MQIDVIAIGDKMPNWVHTAWQEYCKRLPQDWQLNLIEIPACKRGKNAPIDRILQEEGERLLKASHGSDHLIALDRMGKPIDSQGLAKACDDWHHKGYRTTFLVGGPEGLSENCLSRVDERWSLSSLTFPHPVVRIVIAEQIFRSHSILTNHPYHR